MSGNKNYLESMNYHLDQQFQIQTLGDDSSENSSKRDHQNECRIFMDGGDEEKCMKTVRSMENIIVHQHKHQENGMRNKMEGSQQAWGNEDQQGLATPEKEGNNNAITHELSSKNLSNPTNEGTLEKKKRKRRQIFENIKLASNQKSKTKSHKKAEPENSEALQANKQQTTLSRAAFEKKRQNHLLLKSWNYRRLKSLQLHQKICEQLLKGIDKNAKQSLQNFEVFRSFFVQRCRQQQILLNSKLPIKQSELQDNSHSRDIYIACSSVFNSFLKRQKQQKQIITNFVVFLQNKILKQIFDEYLNNVYKEVVALRSKISVMKETLDKLDQATCKKLIDLQTNFTKCCENVLEEQSVDFYRAQISFLTKCETQLSLWTKFSHLLLEYYNKIVEDQRKRKQLLEKCLAIYAVQSQKYQEKLTNSPKSQRKQEVNHRDQDLARDTRDLIAEAYKIQNFVQTDLINQLKNKETNGKQAKEPAKLKQKPLFFTDLQKFLSKLEVQQFDCHHLIIKKFKVEVLKEDKWIPGQIVITVDKFVHVFVYALRNGGVLMFGSQNYYKPEFTMKTHDLRISLPEKHNEKEQIDSDEELQVVLNTKKQLSKVQKLTSFLKSDRKMEESVRFSNQKDLLEFQDYLIQLSN